MKTYGIESHAEPVTQYATPEQAQTAITTMREELYIAHISRKISIKTLNHFLATTVTRVVEID